MGDIIILAGANQANFATAPSHHPKSSILVTNEGSKLNTVNSTNSMGSSGQIFGRGPPQ